MIFTKRYLMKATVNAMINTYVDCRSNPLNKANVLFDGFSNQSVIVIFGNIHLARDIWEI